MITFRRNNPGDAGEPRLVFLHIPKTGGTTLLHLLRDLYPRQTHFIRNGDWRDQHDGVRAIEPKRAGKIRVYMGHTPFGIHEILPGEWLNVTILRHPVSRVASLYHHVKQDPAHHLYARTIGRGMDMAAFASSCAGRAVDNHQTRLLAGGPLGMDPLPGKLSDDALGSALENLASPNTLVGIQERFDETLALFADRLGWGRLGEIESHRVSGERTNVNAVDEATREAVEACSPMDVRLYESARARVEDALGAAHTP